LTMNNVTFSADSAMASLVNPGATRREFYRAAAIEQQAQATQQQLDWLRERVQHALERATGFAEADDPAFWEKLYNEHYGVYTPATEKRTYSYNSENTQAYLTPPVSMLHSIVTRSISCFPAGTKVWTMAGARPIESVKIGDRVLTQDIVTGELDYKVVQS